ncbi:MFS transporter [Clostridium botulinum]|uniref:MFS transporter n=1 Tax=Clostridium TaxID=1485 RepID=UPI00050032BA|nr:MULTISPECIES: MFS transporter [unclassified Clostridium]AIY78776.1 sugar (and other) transporter family protein [Clostridium botulinum 202F]KAI3346422.1 MFS transporter [Clostridium botulinum]KFX54192.1 MFS transporter [Clostridium botulinum]KON13067.1 MFS transporter [Clostridium botulinum]MBY6779643.1 MFS transporter [Clostridium botulinum]
MDKKEKLWTSHFILALFITIGVNLACNLLLSTISIYTKQITNVDTYAGIMTGAFTLAALFIRLLAGKLLDKVGRRKILILGVAITALSTIAYLAINNIQMIILLRIFQGFGFGISSTAVATIVTDVTPKSRMLEGIGYSGVGITITTAIGPSIALALVGKNYENFRLLFITTTVVAIITILISLKLSYIENTTKTQLNKGNNKANTEEKVNERNMLVPAIILFLAAVAESTILAFTALYGIELGFSNIGLFFTINALGILASRLFINQIVSKFGTNAVLSYGLIIFSASIFGMSIVKTMPQLIIFGFLCGIMMGSLLPIINLMILDSVSENKKGMANAIYYALLDGGYGVGSIIWGEIVMDYGYRSIYAYAGVTLMIGVVIFTIYLMKSRKLVLKKI